MPKLPKEVQDQLDEADKIEQDLVTPAPEPDPDAPPTPEPEPAQPQAHEPTQPTGADDWPQKYRTLQGMHTADVTRLNGEIATLKATVTDLTNQITAATKAPAPAPTPEPAQKLLTDSDREAFGADMIDVIQRAAREIAAAEIGPVKAENATLKAEIASMKGTVDTVAEKQANAGQSHFLGELAKLVPDWEVLNTNQAFLSWLAETDPLSGLQRQTFMTVACRDFNAHQAAALFNTWKSTQAPPAPAPQAQDPKADITSQIEPGGSRAHVPNTPTQQKTWSPTEIENFYRDLARGDYKGREAEAERIEAEIDRSLAATAS